MKKILILQRIAPLILISALLFSCEEPIDVVGYGSISGVVVDATTLQPIEGANIVTTPSSVSVLTFTDGTFTISDVDAGDIRVSATKPGYKSGSAMVKVLNNQTIEVTITMIKDEDVLLSVFFSNPTPQSGAVDQQRSLILKWHITTDTKPVDADTIFFNVIAYSNESIEKWFIAEHITDTSTLFENLNFGTTYFWQVIAYENNKEAGKSDVYTFQTAPFPANHFMYSSLIGGAYEIFSSKQDGSDSINLTRSVANDWDARVSPLNDMIAFVSTRNLEAHIYTMDMNGKNQKRITTLPVSGYHNPGTGFCWSPDGGQILYPVYDKLYIIDRDGTDMNLFAQAPPNRHWRQLNWNGYTHKIIALTMGANIFDTEIYSMNEDGSGMTLLYDNEPGRMDSPSFSIDGSIVMFTKDVAGYNVLDGRQLDARIMDKHNDSITYRDLSFGKTVGTNDLYPRFSPDGTKIIFVNTSNTGNEPNSVWIMDSDGENRQKLFDNATLPEWW